MIERLDEALQKRLLRPLDVQFARVLAGEEEPGVLLAAAMLSAASGAGHVCLPLAALRPEAWFEGRDPELAQALWRQAGQPDTDAWRRLLLASPALGDGERAAPLVLLGDRLYLQRNWLNESRVAMFFARREQDIPVAEPAARGVLDHLFPAREDDVDWQKVAAAMALTRRITVISGGPGAGKTTTVAKLLAAMALLHERGAPLRIQLAAPTGKAAARLTESLGAALGRLPLDEERRRYLPREATTLHRLLGAVSGSQRLRYHQDNPLHLDVLVVDEASMVDLPMMANLIMALPTAARVIFLGDRDQLASVEAGAVLGDICRFAPQGYSPQRAAQLGRLSGYPLEQADPSAYFPVGDGICLLRKSYRFDRQSGIGVLAQAVNHGDERQVRRLLQQRHDDVRCAALASDEDYRGMLAQGVEEYRDYLQAVSAAAPPETVLALFQRYRQLCALREGPFGVAGLNQRLEQALQQAGLIRRGRNPLNPWYPGRPVMIARNDAALGVFNGDIGVAMANERGQLRVWFQLPSGEMKAVSPSRLPPHETAYAMTVHKSQGSEFEHTALVLPDVWLPVLTRELVYTAVTRARARLSLYVDMAVLRRAINTPTQRHSGLEDRIKMQFGAEPPQSADSVRC